MPAPPKNSSTNHLNQAVLREACAVNDTLERISARWKIQILYSIYQGHNRFTLLKDLFPSLSDQVLGQRLRALEAENLATRHLDQLVVPSQVQYFATPKAVALLTIIQTLADWEEAFAAS